MIRPIVIIVLTVIIEQLFMKINGLRDLNQTCGKDYFVQTPKLLMEQHRNLIKTHK